MRVLAISHSAVAGPYRQKWRLLSRRKGWNLTLAVPGRWPEGGAMLAAGSAGFEGIQHRVLGVRLPGRIGFFSYRGLDALIAEIKPELVYCEEEPYSLAAFQAARAARSHGAAFVFFSWENIKRSFKPPLNWVRGQVQAMSAGAVLGNSEGMALYRDWGFKGQQALVPQYGVDPRLFKPARRPPRKFTAGYVGRLVREKGAALFVRACAEAGVRGLIVGRGPDEDALRALAAATGAKVEFKAFVPFEERQRIYEGMDLLVLPSLTTRRWKEQFGRVIIEAGACAVPCLGSDSGAIPEVIGEGGLTVPEGDLGALAASLKMLASKPRLLRNLGLAARRRALRRYTEAKLAGDLGKFLESVVGHKRR